MNNKLLKFVLLCFCVNILFCSCSKRENDKQAVFKWLDEGYGMYGRHGKVPYYKTYEQWISAGRKLNNIENILFESYKIEDPVYKASILEALGGVGSEKSIPFLIQAAEDNTLDWYERSNAIGSLSELKHARGFDVSVAIEPLCKIVSDPNISPYPKDERLIKLLKLTD